MRVWADGKLAFRYVKDEADVCDGLPHEHETKWNANGYGKTSARLL